MKERAAERMSAMEMRGVQDLFFDGLYDEGDVAVRASKQNQCWFVPQATSNTRMSEELKIPPQEKLKEAQRQELCPKRLCRSVQTSRSPRLTIQTRRENHARFQLILRKELTETKSC